MIYTSNDKFNIDLKTGEIGEKLTLDFLYSFDNGNWTHNIIDVRNDEVFRKYDVDFIHISKDGDIRKIEVKTDTLAHLTNNIAYEHTSNKYHNTIGCFEKTKADLIFYYLSEVDELYYINVYLLKEYVKNNKSTLREVNMGDCALGYLIRIPDLEKSEIMFKIKRE